MIKTIIMIAVGVITFTVGYYIQNAKSQRELYLSDRKSWWKRTHLEFWKNWVEPFVVAGLLAIVIRTYLLGPYRIPTASMRPTFMEGDRIFVDKLSYRFHAPKRGDIIVFKYPKDPKKDFVKRLIGFPGDKILIHDGKLSVNGRDLTENPFANHYYYNRDDWDYGKEGVTILVPPDSFFVLGDNSAQSSDSRNWGFVPKKNLIGQAFFIWWPPKRIKLAE